MNNFLTSKDRALLYRKTFGSTASFDNLQARAQIIRKIRSFFDSQDFLEVQTPILSADTVIDRFVEPIPVSFGTGAVPRCSLFPEINGKESNKKDGDNSDYSSSISDQNPTKFFSENSDENSDENSSDFLTEISDKEFCFSPQKSGRILEEEKSFPSTFYLQTSPEFAMKRLLASDPNFKSIYQITSVFRQGDRGQFHNVEFSMLEWYSVLDDYQGGRKRLSDLTELILNRGKAQEIRFCDLFCQKTGIELEPALAAVDFLLMNFHSDSNIFQLGDQTAESQIFSAEELSKNTTEKLQKNSLKIELLDGFGSSSELIKEKDKTENDAENLFFWRYILGTVLKKLILFAEKEKISLPVFGEEIPFVQTDSNSADSNFLDVKKKSFQTDLAQTDSVQKNSEQTNSTQTDSVQTDSFSLDLKKYSSETLTELFETILDTIFSDFIQPKLGGSCPLILFDYPGTQSQLAQSDKICLSDSAFQMLNQTRAKLGLKLWEPEILKQQMFSVARRFEMFVDGIELANGYSELQDANELRKRNRKTQRLRKKDGKPELPEETRLLAAMDSGFPACSGTALGVDRLIMVALGAERIEQVIAFPWEYA